MLPIKTRDWAFWGSIQGHKGIIRLLPMHTAIIWRPPTGICQTLVTIIVVIERIGVADDMAVTFFERPSRSGRDADQSLTDMNACQQLGIK
jgi:hypothetical protein